MAAEPARRNITFALRTTITSVRAFCIQVVWHGDLSPRRRMFQGCGRMLGAIASVEVAMRSRITRRGFVAGALAVPFAQPISISLAQNYTPGAELPPLLMDRSPTR